MLPINLANLWQGNPMRSLYNITKQKPAKIFRLVYLIGTFLYISGRARVLWLLAELLHS